MKEVTNTHWTNEQSGVRRNKDTSFRLQLNNEFNRLRLQINTNIATVNVINRNRNFSKIFAQIINSRIMNDKSNKVVIQKSSKQKWCLHGRWNNSHLKFWYSKFQVINLPWRNGTTTTTAATVYHAIFDYEIYIPSHRVEPEPRKRMCNFNKIIQYFIKLNTHTRTRIETINWMLYACSIIWFTHRMCEYLYRMCPCTHIFVVYYMLLLVLVSQRLARWTIGGSVPCRFDQTRSLSQSHKN